MSVLQMNKTTLAVWKHKLFSSNVLSVYLSTSPSVCIKISNKHIKEHSIIWSCICDLKIFEWYMIVDIFFFWFGKRSWLHGGFKQLVSDLVNPLWSGDDIWSFRSGSTLVQLMAWCLMAPSHYLNQCWSIIRRDPERLIWGSFHRNWARY